jgi:glutathione S-transferase
MLTLYSRSTCPFCRRVLAVIDNLDLEVEIKEIADDEAAVAELLEKGGKQQVPYLVDTDKAVEMYESDDIVAHLQKHYGTASTGESARPRIHVGGSTCVSCEG